MQSVYSTASSDWAEKVDGNNSCRDEDKDGFK